MDDIYMFTFRNLKLLFTGISLAILAEGVVFFFFPEKITRWLEKTPRSYLRLIGAVELIIALSLLYLILYR